MSAHRDTVVVRNVRPVIDAETWCLSPPKTDGDSIALGSREWTHMLQTCESKLGDESVLLPVTTECSIADAIETVKSVCSAAIAAECERACATMQLETTAVSNERSVVSPIGKRVVGADEWCRVHPRSKERPQAQQSTEGGTAYIALFRAIHVQRVNGRVRFTAAVHHTFAVLRCKCHGITMAACESFEAAVAEFRKVSDALRKTYNETLSVDGDDDTLSSPQPPKTAATFAVDDRDRNDRTARRMAMRWRTKSDGGIGGDRARVDAHSDIFRAHILRSQRSRLRHMADDACADMRGTGTTAVRELRAAAAKVRVRCDDLVAEFSRTDAQWAEDSRRLAARCARIGDVNAFHETVKAFCAEETRRGDACEIALACGSVESASNRRFQKAWFRATADW